MSSLPEVVVQAPEVVQEAPEALVQHHGYNQEHGDENLFAKRNQAKKRIFGLRPAAFWLSLLLTAVVMAAAIGGGVGGGIASANSRTGASRASASPNKSLPRPTATQATGPLSSGAPYITSTTTTSSTSLPSVIRGDTGCPDSNSTEYASSYGFKFQILCGLQWSKDHNDLANVPAANLKLCMDQCALWNAGNSPDSTCTLAVFAFAWTTVGISNCWLKNVSLSPTYPLQVDDTVACGVFLPG
ncbi:hypothetical protein FGG08_002521 [Glutinoglossum americanum]|uniref:Uncharacterized protein n=1 Tax=Glutinoglossum americanum TaxID=1670608 RepID=A0A9P8ICT0_9PEZI|nr:hypothetical protein FGG08_002521 [Glutinoglossum americanum]